MAQKVPFSHLLDGVVVAVRQRRSVDAGRPSVDDAEQRALRGRVGLVKASRSDENALDGRPILRLPGNYLRKRKKNAGLAFYSGNFSLCLSRACLDK